MKERRPSGEPVLAEVGPPVILSLDVAGYFSVMPPRMRGAVSLLALILWLALAGPVSAQEPPLSPQNRQLLLHPGYFEPSVDTSGHPEDRPVSPLPFPKQDLEVAFRKELKNAGVPLSAPAGTVAKPRRIDLAVSVWLHEGTYYYFLQIDVEIRPEEGGAGETVYEYIWPVEAGQAKPSDLRATLFEGIGSVCRRFKAIVARSQA
jgi:hypothetical protein